MAVEAGNLGFNGFVERVRLHGAGAKQRRDNRAIQSHGRILSSAAKARMLRPYKAQRPVATLRDAYTRCNSNLELRTFAPATDTQHAAIEPRTVEIASNGERLRQFPRTVRQSDWRTVPIAPARHFLHSAQGLECADQHAARRSLAVCHNVQAFVHAVDEVNVGPSRRPEYHLSTWSKAA